MASSQSSDRAPLSLIFPMAGRGERFGTTFKPFLRVAERSFIEAAVEPFRKWRPAIARIVFVFLQSQAEEFAVTAELARMFDGLPWQSAVLERPTAGPAETMSLAVEKAGITGSAIICDCDHAVNVDPLFDVLEDPAQSAACLLPVWDLQGEDVKSWSVAALAADGRVKAIAEKALPPGASRVAGVIGCYYFQDVAAISLHLIRA